MLINIRNVNFILQLMIKKLKTTLLILLQISRFLELKLNTLDLYGVTTIASHDVMVTEKLYVQKMYDEKTF